MGASLADFSVICKFCKTAFQMNNDHPVSQAETESIALPVGALVKMGAEKPEVGMRSNAPSYLSA